MAIKCICGIVRHWNCPACNAADADRQMREMREAKPYVVVELAGTDSQFIVREFGSLKTATDWVNWNYRDSNTDEIGVDVMKRQADGTLSTEF